MALEPFPRSRWRRRISGAKVSHNCPELLKIRFESKLESEYETGRFYGAFVDFILFFACRL